MTTKPLSRWIVAAACLLGLAAAPAAHAESRSICVFDPAGKSGDYYKMMSDYALNASNWGFEVEIKPYTDEETAAKDYEAGQCDGVVATGVRLQRFNNFPSTMEAMGAIPTYGILQTMIKGVFSNEKAKAKLSKDGNVTVGFLPVGAVYLVVRDRDVDTVAEFAGKRIATMDYDKAAPVMVDQVGAVMVPADLGSIGPKFNNGDVDICYVSAPAYRPFELYRGLGDKGGVLKFPMAQATLQVMLRESKFSPEFVDESRKDLFGRYTTALGIVKKAEADIPAKYWVELPPDRQEAWDEILLDTRVKLRDSGAYDGMLLSWARGERCKADASRSECAENRE